MTVYSTFTLRLQPYFFSSACFGASSRSVDTISAHISYTVILTSKPA